SLTSRFSVFVLFSHHAIGHYVRQFMPKIDRHTEDTFALAKERYAQLGANVEQALKRFAQIPISLHCWQGHDVGGFENAGAELGGGLAVTGNYPGKARTPDELRSDFQ